MARSRSVTTGPDDLGGRWYRGDSAAAWRPGRVRPFDVAFPPWPSAGAAIGPHLSRLGAFVLRISGCGHVDCSVGKARFDSMPDTWGRQIQPLLPCGGKESLSRCSFGWSVSQSNGDSDSFLRERERCHLVSNFNDRSGLPNPSQTNVLNDLSPSPFFYSFTFPPPHLPHPPHSLPTQNYYLFMPATHPTWYRTPIAKYQ